MAENRTIMITIGADGKAALAEMGKVRQGVSDMDRQVTGSLNTIPTTAGAAAATVVAAVVAATAYAVSTATTSSIRYLSQMETATLGIATSFMTGGSYVDQITHKVLQGESALKAAQADARVTMEQLQVANMQTIATLDQLVSAYQVALPIAMAKGFNRNQVQEFTVAVVQAAGAIGVPMQQLSQELRALLTGDSWQDARIGQVLGLRPADIAKMKGDADGLFNMLIGRLSAYKIAGGEAQKSLDGLWSNTKDIALQAGGQAFLPLFEAVKYELTQITGSLVTIDEQTKEIKWNPEFLSAIEAVKIGITNIIAEIYLLNMDIDKAGGTMTAFGSRALKVAEVVTRFMTIGQFGDSLKNGSEHMARWNKMYEERYNAAVKALEKLEERERKFHDTSWEKDDSPIYNQKAAAALEDAKAKAAADKARNQRMQISAVLNEMRSRDLLIGKAADEKELLQLDQKHAKELARLKELHASKGTLAEAARLQRQERDDLSASQQLARQQALAAAEAAIARKDFEDKAAWLDKLDAYKQKTGKISEIEALEAKFDRERQLMSLKQTELEVQIDQEKNLVKRNELEAEYWRLTEQINRSREEQGQQTPAILAQEEQLAVQHRANMANIEAAALEARLSFAGQEQAALETHYAWKRQQLEDSYLYEMQRQDTSQAEKLAKEREYLEQSSQMQQEYAQRQAELWWNGSQVYMAFAQQMTTFGVQMLLAEEGQRGQISKRMMASSIRFLGQQLQQFMFAKAREHLMSAAAAAGQTAMQATQHTASLTMLEAEAVAWAAFYAAQSLNPYGGQAFIPAATAMAAVAGGVIPSSMAAVGATSATAITSELGMAAAWAAGGILVGGIAEGAASAVEGNNGSSGSSGGGVSVSSSVAGAPSVSPAGSSGGGGQVINVHIYGNVVDHDKFARELVPSLRKAASDGLKVVNG